MEGSANYIDVTILLAYLRRIARMVVFQGPVVAGEIHEGMNRASLDYLFKAITSTSATGVIKNPSINKHMSIGRHSSIYNWNIVFVFDQDFFLILCACYIRFALEQR